MKLDKEFLIRHRFWVMLSGVGLIWLIALAILLLGPRSKAAASGNAYQAFLKQLQTAEKGKLYNERFLPAWRERTKKYAEQLGTMWGNAWEEQYQRDLLSFPRSEDPKLNLALRAAYFGDDIEVRYRSQYGGKDGLYTQQFKRSEFLKRKDPLDEQNAEPVELPVAFGAADAKPEDGEKAIFNPISWGDQLATPEECWLAQEEVWLRRHMLFAVRDAIDFLAAFEEIRPERWEYSVSAAGGSALDAVAGSVDEVKRFRKSERDPEKARETRVFRNYNWEVTIRLRKQEDNASKWEISPTSTIKNINPHGRPLALVNNGLGLRLRVVRDKESNVPKGGKIVKIRKKSDPTTLERIEGVLLQPGQQTEFHWKKGTAVSWINPKEEFGLQEVFEPATSPIRRIELLTIGQPALAHRLAEEMVMQAGRTAPKPKEPTDGGGDNTPQPGQGGIPGPSSGGMPGGGQLGMPSAGGTTGGGKTEGDSAADAVTSPHSIQRNRYLLSNEQARRIPVAMVLVVDQAHRNDVLTAIANSPLRVQVTQTYWRYLSVGNVDDKKQPSTGGPGGTGGPVVRPPGSGGGGPVLKPPGSGNSKPGDTEKLGPETNRNLVELTVHGVATLYERYPPRKTQETRPPSP